MKYWVHNGFITVDKEKMSKSLGNFFTIQEILNKFDAEVVRFFLLSTHYRSPIEFSDEQLIEAESSIDRYYNTALRIRDFLSRDNSKDRPVPDEKTLENFLLRFIDKFRDAMDDDFNTALAIGNIFELIRILNKYIDGKPSGQKAVELITQARDLLNECGNVLNIFKRTPEEWYRALMSLKDIGFTEEEIINRIKERQKAREQKDWTTSDKIRKELEEKGIILEDKKEGTSWKVKIT